MKLLRALPALIILPLLSACATEGSAPADRLTGRTWQATYLNQQPVTTSAPVTLSFSDGRASGRSGCNRYSGTVTVGDGTIRFAEIMATKMACVDEGAMQTESTFLQVLGAATTWSLSSDDVLIISGDKGRADFKPLAATPRP